MKPSLKEILKQIEKSLPDPYSYQHDYFEVRIPLHLPLPIVFDEQAVSAPLVDDVIVFQKAKSRNGIGQHIVSWDVLKYPAWIDG